MSTCRFVSVLVKQKPVNVDLWPESCVLYLPQFYSLMGGGGGAVQVRKGQKDNWTFRVKDQRYLSVPLFLGPSSPLLEVSIAPFLRFAVVKLGHQQVFPNVPLFLAPRILSMLFVSPPPSFHPIDFLPLVVLSWSQPFLWAVHHGLHDTLHSVLAVESKVCSTYTYSDLFQNSL